MTNDLIAAGVNYSLESGISGWHSDTPGVVYGADPDSIRGSQSVKFTFLSGGGTGYWYVFPEDRTVPLGERKFGIWMKANVSMDVTVKVFRADYAEIHQHTFSVGTAFTYHEFTYVTESTKFHEVDFITTSAGSIWVDEIEDSATTLRYFASTPSRQAYEWGEAGLLRFYKQTEAVTWWKSGAQWVSGNYQENEVVVADDLVGFNGTFTTGITDWYLAGPAGGTVEHADGTLKLTHGGLGGGFSEAGNDEAYANGPGPKRITFRMRASINMPEVQVWPFWGDAPTDWANSTTFRPSVTTEWQTYTFEWEQTTSMFTGLYFDMMTTAGAVAGTQLWIDDIHVTSTEVYRGGYEHEVDATKATELEALGFTIRTEEQDV